MGGMQFQRLLEGGVGLLLLTQAKLPQTDEVMRPGLATAARLCPEDLSQWASRRKVVWRLGRIGTIRTNYQEIPLPLACLRS